MVFWSFWCSSDVTGAADEAAGDAHVAESYDTTVEVNKNTLLTIDNHFYRRQRPPHVVFFSKNTLLAIDYHFYKFQRRN